MLTEFSEEYMGIECSICLKSYEKSEKIVILSCNDKHHFHKMCLDGWNKMKASEKCPICSQNLS